LAWRESEIFLQEGLDYPNQIELLQQIAVYARTLFQGFELGERSEYPGTVQLICPSGKIGRNHSTAA
jgi:hypothetical protein